MVKSLSRDMSVLIYIKKNQDNLLEALKVSKCDFSNTNRGLCNNKIIFDACALYMAQIGENVKLLSDSTVEYLNDYFNTGILRYFRNMIDHSYEKVNRQILQAYIQQMCSQDVYDAVSRRIQYCKQNR
ncbi:hypothetical protein C818_03527 [Lachnospiraceae bacterium MD308]|nr:hypothetical protein C818_03527 [Lachnospiraceae bacterium MD308]